MATQAVTATSKLIYKWYNDGDVFDNTHNLEGWANDLSSYANWLNKNIEGVREILKNIEDISEENEYVEKILWPLHNLIFNAEKLSGLESKPKTGSVYDCDGPYEYSEKSYDDDEEDEWDWSDDEEDED